MDGPKEEGQEDHDPPSKTPRRNPGAEAALKRRAAKKEQTERRTNQLQIDRNNSNNSSSAASRARREDDRNRQIAMQYCQRHGLDLVRADSSHDRRRATAAIQVSLDEERKKTKELEARLEGFQSDLDESQRKMGEQRRLGRKQAHSDRDKQEETELEERKAQLADAATRTDFTPDKERKRRALHWVEDEVVAHVTPQRPVTRSFSAQYPTPPPPSPIGKTGNKRGRPTGTTKLSEAEREQRREASILGNRTKITEANTTATENFQTRNKNIRAYLDVLIAHHLLHLNVDRVIVAALDDRVDFLEELAGTVRDGAATRNIISKYIAEVEKILKERSLPLKETLGLSERTYDKLYHADVDDYDPNTKRYTPILIDGTHPLPRRKPTKPTCEEGRHMFDHLQFYTTHGKEGGGVSLEEAIKSELKMRGINSDGLEIKRVALQISGDGANMGNQTQTAIVFKLLGVATDDDLIHVPELITTVVFYDGDDKYDEAACHLEQLETEIRKIMADGVQTDAGVVQVMFYYGGDLKWINGVNGMAGCSHTWPCPWCDMEGRRYFGDLNPPPTNKRTETSLMEHSHCATLPFYCSLCKTQFNTEADLEKNALGYSSYSEYNLQHHGVKMGDAPLLPMQKGTIIEECHIACALHLVLRLTGNAYQWTIRKNLDAGKGQNKETERRVAAINQTLKELGICVRKQAKPKAKEKIMDAMGKAPSITGGGCEVMFEGKNGGPPGYELALDAIGLQGSARTRADAMWQALKLLKDVVLEIYDNPEDLFNDDAATMELRAKHAAEIKAAAIHYKHAWLAVAQVPERMPIYVHVAEAHLPAMTMKVGSLSRFSMQGEEHLHSVRKRDKKTRSSNRKVGTHGRRKHDGTHSLIQV